MEENKQPRSKVIGKNLKQFIIPPRRHHELGHLAVIFLDRLTEGAFPYALIIQHCKQRVKLFHCVVLEPHVLACLGNAGGEKMTTNVELVKK